MRNLKFVVSVFFLAAPVILVAADSIPMPFQPLPARPAGQTFSFIVYGDVQDNYRNGHDRLVRQMLKENVDFVLNTGDLSSHKGRHYSRDFLPVVAPLVQNVPYFPAVGNHDVLWGSPFSRYPFYLFFREVVSYLGRRPGNDHLLEQGTQKLWYSFVHGRVLFIALDSNLFISEGKYRRTHAMKAYEGHRREQLNWLARTLQRYKDHPEISERFVYFHHSPIISYEKDPIAILGLGGHPGHREMLVNLRLPTSSLPVDYFLDLFRYYRVTAVFTGHEHFYERWREVIRQDGRQVHALDWVVTGTGGVKPRGAPEFREDEIHQVLQEEPYSSYLERVSYIHPGWSASLQHLYPTPEQPEGRFHSYTLVTVSDLEVVFVTRDSQGRVRDKGVF